MFVSVNTGLNQDAGCDRQDKWGFVFFCVMVKLPPFKMFVRLFIISSLVVF